MMNSLYETKLKRREYTVCKEYSGDHNNEGKMKRCMNEKKSI